MNSTRKKQGGETMSKSKANKYRRQFYKRLGKLAKMAMLDAELKKAYELKNEYALLLASIKVNYSKVASTVSVKPTKRLVKTNTSVVNEFGSIKSIRNMASYYNDLNMCKDIHKNQPKIKYKLVSKIKPNGGYKQIRVYKVDDNGHEIRPVVKYPLIDIEKQNNIHNYIKAVG